MTTRPTERQMRTFLVLYAVIFLGFAIVAGALRFLVAPGEPVPPLLYGVELVSAAALLTMGGLLLWVRVSLRAPHLPRVARSARLGIVLSGLVSVLGLCVSIVVPAGDVTAGKFPTIAVTVVTMLFASMAYSGLGRLPR
jgi:hypothetical protein